MKTKDIFNFNRFGKYFVSDLRTCAANYGLSLMTIALLTPIANEVFTGVFKIFLTGEWSGPGMSARAMIFAIAMLCMIVTMPVKCYGKITEKQYGSFWLTLPASRLEKFISMFLMTCILVPLVGAAGYIGLDALLCAIDPTCGGSLATGAAELIRSMFASGDITVNLGNESIPIEDAQMLNEIMLQFTSPWLYIDEIFGITLPFLLGAVYFKSGKTVKTFLALFAFSAAVSAISTPFATRALAEIGEITDPSAIFRVFDNGLFRNLVLIDTVSDAIVNIAIMTGIWFRIKTLKH